MLWKACHEAYDIPYKAPESGDSDFLTSTKYDSLVGRGKFNGFVSHYHITRKKIDCAGLDIASLLNEIK